MNKKLRYAKLLLSRRVNIRMNESKSVKRLIFDYQTTKLKYVSNATKYLLGFDFEELSIKRFFPSLNISALKKALKLEKLVKIALNNTKETTITAEKVSIGGKSHLSLAVDSINDLILQDDFNHYPAAFLNEDFKVVEVSPSYLKTFTTMKEWYLKPYYQNYLNGYDDDYFKSVKTAIIEERIWYGKVLVETNSGAFEPFLTVIFKNLTTGSFKNGYFLKYFPLEKLRTEFSNFYLKDDFLQLIKNRLLTEVNKKKYLLFIDYNNFKDINDNYGHLAGDQAIFELKALICEVFKDGSFTRYGGDEFLILCTCDVEEKTIIELIYKLEEKAKESLTYQPSNCQRLLSVGIASYPQNGESVNELIKSADKAMYLAKQEKQLYYRAYELKEEV